jgi:hypothetical protein
VEQRKGLRRCAAATTERLLDPPDFWSNPPVALTRST